MKKFFNKFESLKGASFIGISEYENKNGEVANINLLTNASVENAKAKDLESLKALTPMQVLDLSKASKLDLETMIVALSEMIVSAEKNLTDDRTVSSQAQSDAYIKLNSSVKLHKETMNVFVTGFINSKTILVEGDYPSRNKREKTLCKDAIKKHCSLRMNDYRQYNVGNMESIKVTGSTLQFIHVK